MTSLARLLSTANASKRNSHCVLVAVGFVKWKSGVLKRSGNQKGEVPCYAVSDLFWRLAFWMLLFFYFSAGFCVYEQLRAANLLSALLLVC
jgi:hypothetical protein